MSIGLGPVTPAMLVINIVHIDHLVAINTSDEAQWILFDGDSATLVHHIAR